MGSREEQKEKVIGNQQIAIEISQFKQQKIIEKDISDLSDFQRPVRKGEKGDI